MDALSRCGSSPPGSGIVIMESGAVRNRSVDWSVEEIMPHAKVWPAALL